MRIGVKPICKVLESLKKAYLMPSEAEILVYSGRLKRGLYGDLYEALRGRNWGLKTFVGRALNIFPEPLGKML